MTFGRSLKAIFLNKSLLINDHFFLLVRIVAYLFERHCIFSLSCVYTRYVESWLFKSQCRSKFVTYYLSREVLSQILTLCGLLLQLEANSCINSLSCIFSINISFIYRVNKVENGFVGQWCVTLRTTNLSRAFGW